jgi:hypothetical protein
MHESSYTAESSSRRSSNHESRSVFPPIDKSRALGTQVLKRLFAPDKGGTLQERIAAEIEDVKAHLQDHPSVDP